MHRPARIIAFGLLFAVITSANDAPAHHGKPAHDMTRFKDHSTSRTDFGLVASTVARVNQRSGTTDSNRPGLPPLDTFITAVDGTITSSSTNSRSLKEVTPRKNGGSKLLGTVYEEVFSGKDISVHDAAIEGTSYLTYTVVDNSTYNVEDCLAFCHSTSGCAFVNLYYEFNNNLLDFVYHEKSNLKCALFGEIHSAVEKTNKGNQQLEHKPTGKTFIRQSSGYAVKSLATPATPDGYEFVFGPLDAANNADEGYMGFVLLSSYDVQACAKSCNGRHFDAVGGECQYFNIYTAMNGSIPISYVCSLYYVPTSNATATNTGQGNTKITLSRGYSRTSVLPDGEFESISCGDAFCFESQDANWLGLSSPNGTLDATIFHFQPYAHRGYGVALLGSAYGMDNKTGTLRPRRSLVTKKNEEYSLQLFHSSAYSGPTVEADAWVDVLWNGHTVLSIRGYSDWLYHEVKVQGTGSDDLAFKGGRAPAYSFLDSIYVFLA